MSTLNKLELAHFRAWLEARGYLEWEVDMIVAGVSAGPVASRNDLRAHAHVHEVRGVIPEREPTARERAQSDAEAKRQRAQEEELEAARMRSAALQDEWNKKR